MTNLDIFRLLNYSIPVFSSLVCALFITLQRWKLEEKVDKKLFHISLAYFIVKAFSWVGVIIYIYDPDNYPYVGPFYLLEILLIQIFFYQLIYTLTRRDDESGFSFLHYVLPLLLFAVHVVWSSFIPLDIQRQITRAHGDAVSGYEAYSLFFNSKSHIRLIFSLVYIVLSFYRLIRYSSDVVNYSADESRISIRWGYNTAFLSIALIVAPALGAFVSKKDNLDSFLVLIPIVVLLIQHIILCYNLLTTNYVLMYNEDDFNQSANKEHGADLRIVTKEQLEDYMRTEKPYLNPSLKITDMTGSLKTNRTYLSTFINQEYGVNFSHFINTYRLEELDKLLIDPKYSSYSNLHLITLAGFGSYDSYLRTKKHQIKESVLPPRGVRV